MLSLRHVGPWFLVLLLVCPAVAGVGVHRIDAPAGVFAASTIPVDGFVPMVLMGITDDGYIVNSGLDSYEPQAGYQPGVSGNWEPSPTNPVFSVVLFDTGANANLLSYEHWTERGLLNTGDLFTVQGAGPDSVDAAILQAYGFFAAGLDAIGPGEAVNTNRFLGASNIRPLGATTSSGSAALPSVLGTATSIFYTTVIRTDQVHTGSFGGVDYDSPRVEMFTSRYAHDVPQIFDHRLKVSYRSGGQTLPPVYVVGDDLFGILPATPTASEALMVDDVTVEHTAQDARTTGGRFLFDTGAQVTVISRDLAMDLSLNLDQPEFSVEITGVGGTLQQVPGYTLDTLRLPATGLGDMVLHDVPIIVINVPNDDQPLDGIIGMNLFTDRNLVIHGGHGASSGTFSNPWVGVTAVNPAGRGTDFAVSSGQWDQSANWDNGLPDAQANAYVQFDAAVTVAGVARAAGVRVGRLGYGSGSLNFTFSGVLEIDRTLLLGANAELSAQAGAQIRLGTGGSLEIRQTDPAALSGLAEATLVALAGQEQTILEAASNPSGGLADNFGVDLLELGYQGSARVRIIDAFDNQLDGAGNEVFAAGNLAMSTGSVLDLGSSGIWLARTQMATVLGYLAEGAIVSDRQVAYSEYAGGILLADSLGGDINSDGQVDLGDLEILSTYFQQPGQWAQGDLNYDGTISFADFIVLSHHFGRYDPEFQAAAEALLVPEPLTIGLLAILLPAWPRRRRGKRG